MAVSWAFAGSYDAITWTIELVKEFDMAKKAKTYKGKSTKLGGGGRFAKMTDALKKKGMSASRAKAIAAAAGRKKYGKKKMATMAARGRKRAAAKKKKK